MRRAVFIAIIPLVLVALYVGTYLVLISTRGFVIVLIDGTPERLRCRTCRYLDEEGLPNPLPTVVSVAFRPLEWIDRTVHTSVLATSDPRAQLIRDVLVADERFATTTEPVPVAMLRAPGASATIVGSARPRPSRVGAVIVDGTFSVVLTVPGVGDVDYRHDGGAVQRTYLGAFRMLMDEEFR